MSPSMSFASFLALAGYVAAHGHVSHVIVNGVTHDNYNPQEAPWQNPPPAVAGWSADQVDNGFVGPADYGNPDIICHRDAKPGATHLKVGAGEEVTLQWTEWPESHHGPVMDHLAPCDGDCSGVDKTSLQFFKIDGVGILEQGSSGVPGKWASDLIIEAAGAWTVKIPASIKPGNYVLRHDIIALHSAHERNGAQNYPQCINLEITGSGSDDPAGVPGTQLFDPNDSSIQCDIYRDGVDYIVPGGEIFGAGLGSSPAAPALPQTKPVAGGAAVPSVPAVPTSPKAPESPELEKTDETPEAGETDEYEETSDAEETDETPEADEADETPEAPKAQKKSHHENPCSAPRKKKYAFRA